MDVSGKAALWAIAAANYGLVTRKDARSVGVTDRAFTRLGKTGQLVRIHEGVYRVRGVQTCWRSRLLAAVRATGPESVASHASAARLHRLQTVSASDEPEICALGSALPILADVTVHRTGRLEPCDRTEVDRIPTTSGARTVIDLAARLTREQLTALVDEAVCRRVTSRRWLYRRACELLAGRTGVGLIIRLTGPEAEGDFRSWLERRGNTVFQRAGLPSPQWNIPIHDERGELIGVFDAYYQSARVLIEFDGLRFHDVPEAYGRDAERTNRAFLAGYMVLRFTWRDVVERPDYVVAQVRKALHL